jgi:hypothetical protein
MAKLMDQRLETTSLSPIEIYTESALGRPTDKGGVCSDLVAVLYAVTPPKRRWFIFV